MTRYYDKVGFGTPGELVNGVWSDDITERDYKGEVLEATSSLEESEKVNTDIRSQNRISIIADAFAVENFTEIKYVMWMGSPWVVQSARVERPRLILSLGGVYNGPRPPIPPVTP